jgi:hypothetical protein
MTIKDVVAKRGIDFVFHFTQLQNLDSILTHGLLPPSQCEEIGIIPAVNDQERLDNTDSICLTIGFPNYMLFYRLRDTVKEKEWAVIGLKPDVLWEKDVAFCRENAAKAEVTAIPLAQRKGVDALEAMFDDYNGIARSTLGIPDHYPTYPQAEVLVFEKIEPEYIVGATFEKYANFKQFQGKKYQHDFEILYERDYYWPRCDHKHWKK